MPKNRHRIHAFFRNRSILWGGFLVVCLAGCPGGGRFNPESHRNVMALKHAHLEFIHEFTEGEEDKTWDLQQFDKKTEHMDSQFQKALSHSQTLADQPRTSNIQLLHKTFHDDKELIHQKNRLLTPIENKMLVKPTVQIYDTALEAECIRRQGPGPGEACIPEGRP